MLISQVLIRVTLKFWPCDEVLQSKTVRDQYVTRKSGSSDSMATCMLAVCKLYKVCLSVLTSSKGHSKLLLNKRIMDYPAETAFGDFLTQVAGRFDLDQDLVGKETVTIQIMYTIMRT